MLFRNYIMSLSLVVAAWAGQSLASVDEIFQAVVNNDQGKITEYIAEPGDLSIVKDGKGLLHECALRARYGIAKKLIESGRMDLLVRDQQGKRADQLVAAGKTYKLLKDSLNAALKNSVLTNDLDFLRGYLLTEHSVNEPVDTDGNTLLHLVAENARKAMADDLVRVNANFGIKNNANRLPLDMTTGAGKTHRLVLSQTNTLYARLKDAVDGNRSEVLTGYPDLDRMDLDRVVDGEGNTLLHIAADKSRFLIAQILIQAGARTDIVNGAAHTALQETTGRGKTHRYLSMQNAIPFHNHLHDDIFKITGADYLHALGYTGSGVNVAMFDASGIDFTHASLTNPRKIAGGGYIFGDNLLAAQDAYTGRGHGYKMARALGGLGGVDQEMIGAAPGVKIFPVLGTPSTNYVAGLENSKNIKVASMSLQGLKFSDFWKIEQTDLGNSDVLFVVIAGNSAANTFKETKLKDGFPLAGNDVLENVIITVNADKNGKLRPKSRKCGNTTKNICVALPGKGDGTTSPTGAFLNGGIALLRQAFPAATAKQIQRAILETAVPVGKDTDTGKGMVDLKGAFNYLKDTLDLDVARP